MRVDGVTELLLGENSDGVAGIDLAFPDLSTSLRFRSGDKSVTFRRSVAASGEVTDFCNCLLGGKFSFSS